MAEKRPLQGGQNVDTCAVCKHCACLSKNLNNCDRCGASLEKDNTAVCYSSEANKRQRLENGTHSNGLGVNGDSETRSTTMNPSNQPVPQALYMNTSNMSAPLGGAGQVRPQALYVNVNNMYPGMNSVVGQGGTNQTFPVSAASSQLSNMASGMNRSMQSMPGLSMSSALLGASPMFPGGQVGASQGARAPPPYQAPSQASRAVSQQLQQPASATRPQQPQSSSSPGPNRNSQQQKVCICASQIRIGLRKFTPSANVVFKQEGVMFTLREYPNAPLLLNARAIMKCKANMAPPYPAFFFYLESSCVKQIRSIFNMRDWEFNEKSTVDKVRCISIFPTAINSRDARTIHETFVYMRSKYQRQDPLLENCTSNDILDIFYGTTEREVPQAATANSSSGSANSSRTSSRSDNSHTAPTQPSPNPIPTTVNFVATGGVPPTVPPGSNPPTIVLPEDNSKWQDMQKTLVRGGVYQVQTQSGEKKFCYWDGTQLISCVVKDSEVQLQCSQVRIGSLRAPAIDFVRVVNDKTKQEVSFKYKGPDGPVSVTMSLLEMIDCLLVCTDRLKALFLYGNPGCCGKVRAVCRMGTSSTSDPYYNVTSKEERQKHLILYLKDINTDQKEALLKMKNVNSNTSVFTEITLMRALKILSDIKSNSVSQSRIDDYFGNRNSPSDIENQLLLDAPVMDGKRDKQTRSHQDDDDDDVIMTQEEIGIKCPYTQQVMQDPMKNKICGHNYEKVAIMEFISRKKLKNIEAKCPYAGCGNAVPLQMEHLEENHELRDYIQKQHKS